MNLGKKNVYVEFVPKNIQGKNYIFMLNLSQFFFTPETFFYGEFVTKIFLLF